MSYPHVMGASREKKLTAVGLAALAWINQPNEDVGHASVDDQTGELRWLSRERSDAPLRKLHTAFRSDVDLLVREHHGQGLEPHQLERRRRLQSRMLVSDDDIATLLIRDIFQTMPPVRLTLHWTYDAKTRKPVVRLEPDILILDKPSQIQYVIARLFGEVWERGSQRLKHCEWIGCWRFIWDPTNNRKKKYCERIHDRERMVEREKNARLERNNQKASPARSRKSRLKSRRK